MKSEEKEEEEEEGRSFTEKNEKILVFFRVKQTKKRKNREIYVYVFSKMSKRGKEKVYEFTHMTHTQRQCELGQPLVSFNSLICLIK